MQHAQRQNETSLAALSKPNETKILAKKQPVPSALSVPKPEEQTPKTSTPTMPRGRQEVTPDRLASKASKARLFDQ